MSAMEQRTAMNLLRIHVSLAILLIQTFTSSAVSASRLDSTQNGGQGSQSFRGHKAAAQYPDTLTGKSLSFGWGFDVVTDHLATDAERYEDELSALFDADLSDWQLIPRDGYTLAARPIEIDGQQDAVIYTSSQHKTPGGRAFFEFLMTSEGQKLVDPATDDMEKARAYSKTIVGPDYATVYPLAQITKLPPPSPIPAVIYTGAVHWQMCDAHQLTEFTYPAHVPVKDRLPSVRQLSGKVPEYTIVYGMRVRQIDPETIEIQSIFWNSLLRGAPVAAALQALEQPYPPFFDRVNQHLQEHSYPPPTGHECDEELVEGGFGVMADVETLMSVVQSAEDSDHEDEQLVTESGAVTTDLHWLWAH